MFKIIFLKDNIKTVTKSLKKKTDYSFICEL